MKVARLADERGTDFAVSQGPKVTWIRLRDLGIECADTADVITHAAQLEDALREGSTGVSRERKGADAAKGLRHACPIVRPSKMIAVGLNYRQHAQETGATLPSRPLLFAKYPSSLTGPFDDVVIGPRITERADYEVELAVVIGRTAKGVTPVDALSCVFGYTVANDVSARDWQRADGQFSRSKSADTFCPVGPWIVTPDEIASLANLELRSKVNGENRQFGSVADMVFPVQELISFISQTITLFPGDVILTGTPPGVGQGFDPPRFLAPGDEVECSISGIGSIRNRFVAARSPALD